MSWEQTLALINPIMLLTGRENCLPLGELVGHHKGCTDNLQLVPRNAAATSEG
jgi:hypothetical protein